jgi:hypothetical protein
MASFPDVWNKLFLQPSASGADAVFSITEDAINSYLRAHFSNDSDKYKYELTQKFQTADGSVRTFTIVIQAHDPLVVTLPPFDRSGGHPAVELPAKPRHPALHAPEEGSQDPNIKVSIGHLALSIQWDKLDGTGQWTWTPSDISAEAECYVSLIARATSPTDDEATTAHYLSLTAISMGFSKTDRYQLSAQFQAFINKLDQDDKKLVLSEAVDKFDDLLVIALNIVATKACPQMVQNIEIPSPILLNQHVVPAALQLSDKQIAVAFALDRAALVSENTAHIANELGGLERAIDADLADWGGIAGLAIKPRQPGTRSLRDLELYSTNDIISRMSHTGAFIKDIRHRQVARLEHLARLSSRLALDARLEVINAGVGIAIDEAILTSLAQDALPQPTNQCSDWLTILDAVRGRACYWARIFDASVSISGTTVSGSVGINAGGDLEACVRKFWDCSWSWDCGSLGLWVTGYPGIQLALKSANGIAFNGQITGGVTLQTNLPFPFNKVIEAVSGIIIQFIMAIVNLFLEHVTIVLVPPALSIPQQKTKVTLTNFNPFAYQKQGSGNDPHSRFIAYSVDTGTST